MSYPDKRKMPNCYNTNQGGNMNNTVCQCGKIHPESMYTDERNLDQMQKETEMELENARQMLKTTENNLRQNQTNAKGCAKSPAKRTPQKACNPQNLKPNVLGSREALRRLAKVNECPGKGKSAAAILPMKPSEACENLKQTKELPSKPLLTSEEINSLIDQEVRDVESAWTLTSESRESYKKPCPKQQKARDVVKALLDPKKEEAPKCPPLVIKETLPFVDPDPDDITPEVAANMMYTQEKGVKMVSCPEETVKQLFPQEFGAEDTEAKKPEAEDRGEVEEEGDDAAFARNMAQREAGEEDRGNVNIVDGGKKREFLLQEKAGKCISKVQLRGNYAPWFPGYFIAFPGQVGESIQLAKSPSGIFQKAWTVVKPSNVPPTDIYVVD